MNDRAPRPPVILSIGTLSAGVPCRQASVPTTLPLSIGLTLGLLSVLLCLPARAAEPVQKSPPAKNVAPPAGAPQALSATNFEDHILPIFQARCLKCHGETLQKAGLDLRRKSLLLKGGDSGTSIIAGDAKKSLLMEMLNDKLMPPEGEPALEAGQIATIRRWIDAGAPLKGPKEEPLATSPMAQGDSRISAEDRNFWSFKPVVRPAVPSVKNQARVRTPIDAFLLKTLEGRGGTFQIDAKNVTLVRRLYFDVWGLPPTPEQVTDFLDDRRPDAYERLVERLLASPRFGERWARHWLDISGHADSDGFLDADRVRPEAWRYRDYVVRALNHNKPYDRFVLEQVAGDELADWRRAESITPDLADNLVATGFLRTAADPTNPGYKEPAEIYKVMADTVEIFSSTFLGLSVQCARCHTHKFDPISHRDYYKLQATLYASYDPTRWVDSPTRSIPLATEKEQARINAHNGKVNQEIAALNKQVTELKQKYFTLLIEEAKKTEEAKRSEIQKKLVLPNGLTEALAGKILKDDELAKKFLPFSAELDALNRQIAAKKDTLQSIVLVRGLYDLDDKPNPTPLLLRGDWAKPAKPVPPGVPTVLAPADFQFAPQPGYKTTGRRLALARWLVDPQHPLTARVHVNRIWARYFSRGIVSTVDNFGKAGERPTHPELLDWLASEFMARGWSQKELHRLILNSTAYRQSSQPNPHLSQSDPENLLLGSWRPRRVEGEIVRDAMLAVNGKLNSEMYGTPVPIARQGDGQIVVADSLPTNRRSVYLQIRRSQPVTLLELFDSPRVEVNCTQRTNSIVVTQALTLLNGQFTTNAAAAFAQRVRTEMPGRMEGQIERAIQLLYSRRATAQERTKLAEFLNAVMATEAGKPMSQVTPAERDQLEQKAWTQLAIVLFNSNEFLYIN